MRPGATSFKKKNKNSALDTERSSFCLNEYAKNGDGMDSSSDDEDER